MMSPAQIHARIIQHPFASLIQGGRLDSFYELEGDILLDVQGLQIAGSELFEQDGKIMERISGNYIPMRLRFSNVSKASCDGFFTSLDNYAEADPSRTIVHFLSWRQPKRRDIFYILGTQGPVYGSLHLFAQQLICEKLKKPKRAINIERDWSPAPPMPERLVPRPYQLYQQFGGDSITIHINGRVRHRQLFIGGTDIQPKHRPQVDAVLNLGEENSRWIVGKALHPNDRAINKGEGSDGMTIAEIREEAEWVIEHLKQNQKVLVHCVAGMNRSTTICCAALMLLEGLGAEAALERVQEHHPWARPDSHHWITLRWLEKTNRRRSLEA